MICSLVADYRSERQPLEKIIHLLEDTVWLINVLTKTLSTFLAKSEISVDFPVFVITSQHKYLLWVLQLERQQQAQHFKTLSAAINIIAQEKVIIASDISRLTWRFPNVEEAHQVMIVTVNVAEDLNRRLEVVLDQNGLRCKHLLALGNKVQDLLLFNVEWLEKAFGNLPVLRLQ